MKQFITLFLASIFILGGNNLTNASEEDGPEYLAYKKTVSDKGLPILIHIIKSTKSDNTDAVGVTIKFENLSNKSIQDVQFIVSAINTGNEPVYSESGRSKQISLKYTMDMAMQPGKFAKAQWGTLWHDHSITHIKLLIIKIKYEDSSSAMITSADNINLMTMPAVFQNN